MFLLKNIVCCGSTMQVIDLSNMTTIKAGSRGVTQQQFFGGRDARVGGKVLIPYQSLSTDLFEPRTSTRSLRFLLLACFHA